MPNLVCPSCGEPSANQDRFCGKCGADRSSVPASSGSDVAATATSVPEEFAVSMPHLAHADGRFAAGTMISERYRIVGLLGRGGMGEVYRADDLKLGQPVALKFLPGHLERDPLKLSRFINEVRTALKVSHPNVCRVHDINDVGGRQYISMEFVDGDDLGTLLRRIGRFPSDKATEIARQLCAGLAAAHAEGILHRDLKPANIMIDGRGQAKITDFGLSGLAGEFKGDEVTAGTPSYMAPEQLSGQGVSIQSDIYALGLVLYEVYTGRPAYEGATLDDIRRSRASAPTSPSSHVEQLDPAVERVILSCLEREPTDRPNSALAVVAALPGGDPLAAALAAGETPDPQLVAEAGAIGGLTPRIAIASAVACVALMILLIPALGRFKLVSRVDLPKPPAVLADKATEILAEIGYAAPPGDSLFAFEVNRPYYDHLESLDQPDSWDALAQAQPSAILFGYRQDPSRIEFESEGSIGNWIERSPSENPGAVRMHLDPQGRLVGLTVVPPEHQREDHVTSEPDWTRLLAAAGLDSQELTEAESEWPPPFWADHRRAWVGVYPDAPDVDIRIEAASYGGLPVSFWIIEPWYQPLEAPTVVPGTMAKIGAWVRSSIYVTVLLVSGFVAWRNVRLRRGDHRTAVRFAFFLGVLRFVWFLGAHHVPSGAEIGVLQAHLSWSAQRFVLAYVFYLAFEPYARKLWPHMLTSWVRLFDRRFRDPLVGRDLLMGVLMGTLSVWLNVIQYWTPSLFGLKDFSPFASNWSLEGLRGFSHSITAIAATQTISILDTFIGLMVLLTFRLVARRTWLAVALTASVFVVLVLGNSGNVAIDLPFIAAGMALALFFLFRFGLLTFIVGSVLSGMFGELTLTLDLTSWWSTTTWLFLLVFGSLTIWGFWTSLAGRPVFKDQVLGPG